MENHSEYFQNRTHLFNTQTRKDKSLIQTSIKFWDALVATCHGIPLNDNLGPSNLVYIFRKRILSWLNLIKRLRSRSFFTTTKTLIHSYKTFIRTFASIFMSATRLEDWPRLERWILRYCPLIHWDAPNIQITTSMPKIDFLAHRLAFCRVKFSMRTIHKIFMSTPFQSIH